MVRQQPLHLLSVIQGKVSIIEILIECVFIKKDFFLKKTIN